MIPLYIEKKRQRMIELGIKHGLSAKETIKCSQELDILLNLQLQFCQVVETRKRKV